MNTSISSYYQPPGSQANSSTGEYYAEELSALPYWPLAKCMANSIPFPLAVAIAGVIRLRGLANWPLQPSYAKGPPGSARTVDAGQVPRKTAKSWAPLMEQLTALGFRPLIYAMTDVIGAYESASTILLDTSGTTLVVLEWIRMPGAKGVDEQTPFEFQSVSKADPQISTVIVKKEFIVLADALIPDYMLAKVIGDQMPVAEAYRLHQERIRLESPLAMTPESALKEHRERSRRFFDCMLQRKIIRKLTPAEIAAVRMKRIPLTA